MGATPAVRPGLWLAVFIAPCAWMTTLLVNYLLVARACSAGLRAVLVAIPASMILTVSIAAFISWRTLRNGASDDEESDTDAATQTFLARTALLSCALFAVAIVAQALAPAIVHDCH